MVGYSPVPCSKDWIKTTPSTPVLLIAATTCFETSLWTIQFVSLLVQIKI
jgi:hypothetical protein